MERTKKERTALRSAFTKLANTILPLLKESTPEVSAQITMLKAKYERLLVLNNEILSFLLESDTSEDNIQAEMESADNYNLTYLTLCEKYENAKENSKSAASTIKPQPKTNLKLPELEIIKFEGDVRQWITFWGQFSKIHSDESTDDQDKFQYLLRAIPEGSPARGLIESFPPSAQNYPKAIEHLTQRYGREELLIEVYMRDLLSLVLLQARQDKLPLVSLYDKLNTQLRALESMGLTNNKYAVMLYPLVESALPEELLKIWERERRVRNDDSSQLLTQLLSFLKQEVESTQRISMARACFSEVQGSSSLTTPVPTTSCFITTDEKKASNANNTDKSCIWCEKPFHNSIQCAKAASLTLEQRKDYVKKIKACAKCLRQGHDSFRCRTFVKCVACLKRHHNVLFCPELSKIHAKTSEQNPSKQYKQTEKETKENTKVCLTCPTNNLTHDFTVTLLQTLLVKIKNNDKEFVVRALIDSGAQRSYIKQQLAKDLDLSIVDEKKIGHVVFGGVQMEQISHKLFNITISSLDETYTYNMMVLDQENICGIIPRVYECKILEKLWRHGVTLTDVGRAIPEITLLIGADYCGMLMTQQIVQLDDGLTAVRTKLGWTVQGMTPSINNVALNNLSITDLWDLDTLGIKDPAETKTQRDHEIEVMERFVETITINEEFRYEVSLPWKEERTPLLNNKELAVKRLHSTTKRLIQTNNFDAYEKVFSDWEKLGIIEEVEEDDHRGHYLAHHPVIKESSTTTRVRPVFDASAKDKTGNSLNQCLEKGLNLLEQIPKLLIQFRLNPVGITADIEKAFLQISLKADDRNYLKFLWWRCYGSNGDRLMKTYRHSRVVFGLTCSPFLLEATINYHLQKAPTEFKNTADRLLRSFYVDNVVISLEESEVNQFMSESKQLMNHGKFNLREWVTAPMTDHTPEKSTLSILGLMWNTNDDELFLNVHIPAKVPEKLTRRTLLSVAQSIFDPVGFAAPTALVPKLLLQLSWSGGTWDDELPQNIANDFRKWWEQVHILSEYRIPRRLIRGTVKSSGITLHAFSDASIKSFACCIFMRSVIDDEVTIRLVMAKARVAPTKQKLTIPRLELVAALISTRLCNQVKEALRFECPAYLWTDSTVVLAWIKNIQAQWTVFVQNRVKEIRRNSDIKLWRFVPSILNPADLPSRGCDPKTLLESRWWEGPQWLKLSEDQWPQQQIAAIDDEKAVQEAIKSSTKNVINIETLTSNFTDSLLYFSKYTKILRMLSWIYRFIDNSRGKSRREPLSGDEVRDAELKLFKIIQTETKYEAERKRGDLSVKKDENGLFRVQTKLVLSDDNDDFTSPILLFGKHSIVERLVRQRHAQLCHAGVGTLLTVLRETYWIIGIRRLAKKIVSECGRCKRFKSKPCTAPEAPLPRCRTNQHAAAFETCGIDYAGPLLLKSKEKAYIVLFTCAVYRAVHFELTTSLSTEAFLMALRRFIARRGRVSTIYTDNGTNFVGAARLLRQIDWNLVQASSDLQPVKWVFNVPSGPWWGGWWERLIRSLKDLLRRVLGKASVTYVEMETVLCDCEAVVNSRPLTYVAENDTLSPLTPNHFLQSIPRNQVPELNFIDSRSLNERVRYTQKLRQDLCQRFRSEYLSMLVQRGRTRSSTPLKIGDVVLIETPEKRIHWPLGVVTEIIMGKDGETRVAKVRTERGELQRPVQRLYLLEVCT